MAWDYQVQSNIPNVNFYNATSTGAVQPLMGSGLSGANTQGTLYSSNLPSNSTLANMNAQQAAEQGTQKALEQANIRSLTDLQNKQAKALDFQNSWIGGRGLAALQGIGTLANMYFGYRKMREDKKNAKLQRQVARYNFDRVKHENNRLDKRREDLTRSFYNNKGLGY